VTGQVAHVACCKKSSVIDEIRFFSRRIHPTDGKFGCSSFLKHDLPAFAKANPQIEIRVSPKPNKHPVVKGQYINGRIKAVCVRNMDKAQILKKANLLKEASGEKLKRTKKPVTSLNESVRGIWSPYHGDLKMV
jgi:large subunit ribosomal protein L43